MLLLPNAVAKAQSRTCKYSFILNIFQYARLRFIFPLLLSPALSDWHFLETPDDFQPQAVRAGTSPADPGEGFAQGLIGCQWWWMILQHPWCCGESQVQVLWALQPVTMQQHSPNVPVQSEGTI